MRSYLSLIPISAKVHRRQNRMTLLCIVFAVFMVTAVFSMAEMDVRMEQARLVGKHGALSMADLLGGSMGQSLLLAAVGADCGCFNDFQQHEQHRCPANQILRHDALHRYEQAANCPLCAAGSAELVQDRYPHRPWAGHYYNMGPVRCAAFSGRRGIF